LLKIGVFIFVISINDDAMLVPKLFL